METVEYESEFTIRHDHTQLDILFEDLRALVKLALSGEREFLQDARVQWQTLQKDLAGHFSGEERALFQPLAVSFPALSTTFQGLVNQHLEMLSLLKQMNPLFEAGPLGDQASRAEFEARWSGLESLWTIHSQTEWRLFQAIASALRTDGLPLCGV